MKLHEYQAKRIFGEYGIAVPRGVVADTPALARAAAAQIGLPVVIKAQVLTGGRGKAGGVKVAKTLDEVEAKAKDILALSIKDIPVEKVLIDPAANIKHEIYLGVTMDRPNRRALLMASVLAGVLALALAALPHAADLILQEGTGRGGQAAGVGLRLHIAQLLVAGADVLAPARRGRAVGLRLARRQLLGLNDIALQLARRQRLALAGAGHIGENDGAARAALAAPHLGRRVRGQAGQQQGGETTGLGEDVHA